MSLITTNRNPKLRSFPRIMLMVLALGCVAWQLAGRFERTWPREPSYPFVDSLVGHWFYDTLAQVTQKGQSMAIWGWAAHAWVYSGLLPGTRESSTEFAARDWGPNSYYRKRFVSSLRDKPPEYFMEAVGPGHFFFNDRSRYGITLVPGLEPVIAQSYVRVLDDLETALYFRRDLFASCCALSSRPIQNGLVPPGSLQAHLTQLGLRDAKDWLQVTAANGGAWVNAAADLPQDRPISYMATPFVLGRASDSSLRIVVLDQTDRALDCHRLANSLPSDHVVVCRFAIPDGYTPASVQVALLDQDPSQWLAVGPTLIVFAETGKRQ